MTKRACRSLSAALACSAGLALSIGVAAAQTARPCAIEAYTTDEDPKGINIRSAPSAQAKVVGVIPRRKDDDVQVSIVAENGGWFRLKSFTPFSTEKAVAVDGWVHGSRLGADLVVMQGAKASERLREEPSSRSKTLLLLSWDPGEGGREPQLAAELPGGRREAIDFQKIKRAATAVPLACEAGYVKVRVHKYQGWLPKDRLCGNPVTNCN